MDSVLRATAVYFILLVVLRFTGKRPMGNVTTFDFVLLLIIGESTQQALIGEDFSVTTAAILIVTLLTIDLGLSLLKPYFPSTDDVLESLPLVIAVDGKLLKERTQREHIDEGDVLAAARGLQGLERMDQIKYAVLEKNGKISVVPKDAPARVPTT